MNELERQLRETLRTRAEDAEPTPDLWFEVQERRERKRRVRWFGALAAAAAAVVVAVVAVPFALNALQQEGTGVILGDPPATDPATDPVTDPEAVASPTGPPRTDGVPPPGNPAFASDGTGLYHLGPDGTFGDLLYRFPAEGESSIVAFAVRPSAETGNPQTTTIAMLTQAEGTYDLRWLDIRYADGAEPDVTVELFPQVYNVQNHQIGGSVPAPVWSPDGRHLAFVEDGDEGEPGLRVIGWSDDGPGTGRTADDNTSFGYPIFPQGVDAQLQDWTWDGSGETVQGTILASARGGGGYNLEVERQGDGAIAYRRTLSADPGGSVLDVAGSTAGTVRLTASGAGEGTIDLTLTLSAPESDEDLPLPPELDVLQSSDPTGIWMNAAANGVLVGDGSRAWLVTMLRNGEWEVTPVPGTLTYADFAR